MFGRLNYDLEKAPEVATFLLTATATEQCPGKASNTTIHYIQKFNN